MKNGKWTVWDSTLQAQLEISWKDNKKIGKVIHPSKKRKINESVIAIKDGERTEWYANGKPKSKKSYINGKRHGEWTYWYANVNKRLKFLGLWKRGQKVSSKLYLPNAYWKEEKKKQNLRKATLDGYTYILSLIGYKLKTKLNQYKPD